MSVRNRRPRRYRVEPINDNYAKLHVYVDCVLGEAGTVREFWALSGGGYLRELFDEARHGTLAPQVCDRLDCYGSTLTYRVGEATVADIVRREARVALRSDPEQSIYSPESTR